MKVILGVINGHCSKNKVLVCK